MKKYDLILPALYVLLLLLVWAGLSSVGKQFCKAREEVAALCEQVAKTKVNAVVIGNTGLKICISRTSEEEGISIKNGRLPANGMKIFRLSKDTLYIGGSGKNRNFLNLTVPDSVQVYIQEAPNVYYKE